MTLLPRTREQIEDFFKLMERKYGYDRDTLLSLSEALYDLVGDDEAVVEYLVGALTDEE